MRSKALLVTVASAALVAGCSGGTSISAAGKDEPSPTASASATPSPAPSPTPTGNRLTGLAPTAGPVVAIKVDNGLLARPYQRGLTQAAVVYQELVEGGSTRFLAVFQSATATSEVGPVRSARESDLDILRAYGKPALGFSGAQSGVFALVRSAARAGRLVDASYDSSPSSYRLGERRRDARNFFVVPARLGDRRGGDQARDVGFRFGVLGIGVPTASAVASFSPSATVKIRFDVASGRYVLSQGGRVIPVSPANVIVQSVTVRPSRFHDVNGMNSPLTISTGGGRSIVLRDGMRFAGSWKRSGYGATHYRDATGHDVMLKPGPTWILLVPKGRPISFG